MGSNQTDLPTLDISDSSLVNLNKKLVNNLYEFAKGNTYNILESYGVLLAEDNVDNETCLHTSIRHNNSSFDSIFRVSITDCKDIIRKKNSEGQTPFLLAVKMMNLNAINSILEFDNHLNDRDNRGNTFLHYLASNEDSSGSLKRLISNIKKIKEYIPLLTNSCNYDNRTPLHLAVMNNCLIMTKLLVNFTNINIQDSVDQRTVFHHALVVNNRKILRTLLCREGINYDLRDKESLTVFELALKSNNYLSLIDILYSIINYNTKYYETIKLSYHNINKISKNTKILQKCIENCKPRRKRKASKVEYDMKNVVIKIDEKLEREKKYSTKFLSDIELQYRKIQSQSNKLLVREQQGDTIPVSEEEDEDDKDKWIDIIMSNKVPSQYIEYFIIFHQLISNKYFVDISLT